MLSPRHSPRWLRSLAIAFVLLWPAAVHAQTPLSASWLNLGPDAGRCRLRVGSGSPEGVVTEPVCTQYLNITDGAWWRKDSGSGNAGWVPVTMITSTSTTSTVKAPSFVRNNALTVAAGQGIGYWMQLAPASGGSCNTANPAANDFVAFYACMESVSGRDTATLGAGKGLWGANYILTANPGFNFALLGIEVDIQNVSGEGTAVPAAHASNGKLGYSAVLASNATTNGDGSAGFATHINGSDTNDLWKYGFEAAGVRTASFYARGATNIGNVSPTTAFLNDSDATNLIKSTGTHTMILDTLSADIFASGRMDMLGALPSYELYGSGDAADQKRWRWIHAGGHAFFQAVNDAYSVANTALMFQRGAGAAVASVNIGTNVDFLPLTSMVSDIGSDALPFGVLHATELMVQTLTAKEVISTIGGNLVVAPTTLLTADLAPGGTTITVKHNQIANGDRIVMKGIGKFEWMLVTSAAGGGVDAYTYTVTRDADGTGANQWYVGDAVLNSGTTGDGFINLYSESELLIDGTAIGPAITGYVRTGTTWNQMAARWVIGNLNGNYGYVADTYGAAFGDAAAAWVKIDPTNGVRIGHNATTKVQIDASGNASFAGTITATAGAIGGWTIGATALTDTAGVVGMSSAVTGGDDIRYWAGDATPANAEFKVTEAGAMTASSATITGSITATAGAIGGCTIAATSITCGSGFSVTNAGVIAATSGTIGGWTLGTSTLTGTNVGLNVAVTGGLDYRFWSGDSTASAAEFSVDENGHLVSLSATFGSGSTTVDVDGSGLVVNGGRISAGGGDVVIDDDGILLTAGAGVANQVKWTGGSSIWEASDVLTVRGDFGLSLTALGAGGVAVQGDGVFMTINGTSTTTDAGYPVVSTATDGSQSLLYKTDGYNGTSSCAGGTWVDTITVERGIFISNTCAAFADVPEIVALRAEIAELRQMVLSLSQRGGLR